MLDEHDQEPKRTPAAWLAAPLLVIVAITLYEVVARYIFGRPTIWANELSLFLSAVVFLISGAYVMWCDDHLRISVIYELMPRPLRRAFDAVTLLCALVFCGGLAWFGFPTSWRALVAWERFGTAWNPPIPAVVKPLIVAVATVMAVFAVLNFVRAGRRPPVEDERIT
jgi:TRAP-type C4-dicarboxylate transport system permease small subunit